MHSFLIASELTPDEILLDTLVARQLSAHTRKAYRQDGRQFSAWLIEQGLTLATLTAQDLWIYRRWLADTFAKTSATRKLVVVRRLVALAYEEGRRSDDPTPKIANFSAQSQPETPHLALTLEQAQQLLSVIDRSTAQGKRDFALVLLLLRTGMRRSECAALTLADLKLEQGHWTAFIRHAKGDKRRKIKIPVDVKRALDLYLAARTSSQGPEAGGLSEEAALFVQFRRGDHPTEKPISSQLIERLVKTYALKVGFALTPHGLRATFVTLALEAGAKLQQVQYAVGHADPRTTERYHKRKFNLDQNAVDFVFVNTPDTTQ